LTKIRVYELARELELESKDVLKFAADLGFDVKNHMSNLEREQAEQVRQAVRPAPAGKKAAQPEQKKAQPAPKKAEPEGKKAQPEQKKPAAVQRKAEAEKKKAEPAAKKPEKPRAKDAGKPKPKKEQEEKKIAAGKPVQISAHGHTVAELAKLFNMPAAQLIKELIALGVMAAINQHLDADTAEILAAQLGIEVSRAAEKEQKEPPRVKRAAAKMEERAPVVTVMGHVDHGKTSLLDAIRNANVTASEAGGITQHIGAYQVEHNGKKIVFLDTPGHEAFTAMRARGAKVTDIAVLVVAADEGVMPQTIEALNHAKAANVPVIVALNKMDKPAANPQRVQQQLANHGLMPEEWGGDTIYVEVSALTGQGIDDLLEMILLSADMLELAAPVDIPATGTVIEAKLDRGRGPVATVLIQEGTLAVGDAVVCGSAYGKVRAMFNDRGQRIEKSGPSVPVEILGLSDVPPAGELLQVVEDDKTARQMAQDYSEKQRAAAVSRTRVTLEDVFKQLEDAQNKELRLLLKSDVQGTTEAIKHSLGKLAVKDIKVNIIHDGVGAINQSDVMLASASDAIIIGFNVRPDAQAAKLAEEEKVDIRLYTVIYELLDDVKLALEGLLEPEYTESVIGRVEVRNTFRHSKLGTIAGCYVIDGKVTNKAMARLLRNGVIIFDGRIASLKRFKDDVKEVSSGYECGMMLENFNDIKEGDQIEVYVMVEEK